MVQRVPPAIITAGVYKRAPAAGSGNAVVQAVKPSIIPAHGKTFTKHEVITVPANIVVNAVVVTGHAFPGKAFGHPSAVTNPGNSVVNVIVVPGHNVKGSIFH